MAQIYRRKGGETLVNSETSGNQSAASVAALAGGGYIVTWTDASGLGADNTGTGVKAQRFDADGNKVGGEFLVNTAIANNQSMSAVTTLASGRFVVTWQDGSMEGGDTSSVGLKGQLFEADGTKVGSEFLVNTTTQNAQQAPMVSELAGGGFVVAWMDASLQGGDTSGTGIRAQVFDGNAAKVGGEFLVNTVTQGGQTIPMIAPTASGGFIVAWNGAGTGTGGSIRHQLFDALGAPIGTEQVATDPLPHFMMDANIATLPTGFALVWAQSESPIGSGPSVTNIMLQLLDANGGRVGGPVLVNSTTEGSQRLPDIDSLPGGGFLVTWQGPGQSDGLLDVFGQVFDAGGAKVGVEFVLSSITAGTQSTVKVDVLASGDIAIVWTDGSGTGGDASGLAVKSQILTLTTDAPTDIALSDMSVSETALGNNPVAILSSTGAINSSFTYEIVSDSSGGGFGVDGDRLIVADNARLDFETAPSVEIRVRTTDLNGHSYEETFTIAIEDEALEMRYSAGEEFRVNTDTDGFNVPVSVTALSSGGFLVVTSVLDLNATVPQGLRGQIYDAAGNPAGGEFDLDLDDRNGPPPQVVALPTGGFLVVYEGNSIDLPGGGNGFPIRGQMFDAAGNEVGPDFLVSTTNNGILIEPSVAVLDSGNFVVTWGIPHHASESGDGTFTTDIMAQMFNASGAKLGGELRIDTNPDGQPLWSQATATAGGGFVVIWYDGGDSAIKGQFFNPGGVGIGGEFTVFAGDVEFSNPSVVMLASGNLLVSGIGDEGGLVGQLVDSSGANLGAPMVLAPAPMDTDAYVAALPGGGFVVTWIVETAAGTITETSSFAQIYSESGQPVGDAFLVPGSTAPADSAAHIAVLDSGDLVFAWTRNFLENNFVTNDAYARILTPVEVAADPNVGTPGDDVLTGTPGADVLRGLAGDDAYFVDNIGDVVIEVANEGYDIIYAGVSYALAADTFVEVLATIDNTATTPLNLTGNALANYVTGNAGANILDGGAGPDQLWGRGGDDSYYADAGDDVVEYEGDGYDILYARSSYALGIGQSIEVLATIDNTATTAINLAGNALSNYIVGNAGANTLNGGGGDDQLWGREGDDSYIADMNDIVLEYAGQGNDILYATASYILAVGLSVETLATADNTATTAINLTGNELDNYVTGNAGANTLDGGTGSDTLWGRGGDDSYFADGNDVVLENAGEGSDIIYARGSFVLGAGVSVEILATVDNTATTALNLTGNELDNYVTGNAGANILDGGLGADQLFGRGGPDTFAFTSALGGGNVDQILDFMSGGLDRIALDDAVFAGLTPGALPPGAFAVGSSAQEADDRILYNPQTGQLFFDADGSGSGAAILFATVTPGTGLSASDFMVI